MKSNAKFVAWVAEHFPEHFDEGSTVIDVGSFDPTCFTKSLCKGRFVGIDVAPGPNVTMVAKASNAPVQDASADTVLCVDALQHDMYFDDTLTKMYNMLRRGGLLVMTFATAGRWESGTTRASPEASLTTSIDHPEWGQYYKNLNVDDIKNVFGNHGVPLDDLFTDYAFYENADDNELYFAGVKRSDDAPFLPSYPDATCVARQSLRAVIYVACRSSKELEAAQDACDAFPYLRPAFVPTTFFGHHVMWYHTLPSIEKQWHHASCVGAIPWTPTLAKDLEDVDRLVRETCWESSSEPRVDVACRSVTQDDAIASTAKKHPNFDAIWRWLTEQLGYGADMATRADIADVSGAWVCRPQFMMRFAPFVAKARVKLETAPAEILGPLWAPSGLDDPHMTVDDKFRAWGAAREPHHRLVASKLLGFFCTMHSATVFNV